MDQFILAFIILIMYIILLFSFKRAKWNKKQKSKNCNNCCPDCKLALSRIQRKISDHIIHHITLRIFNSKRYVCTNCGWSGLRWEEKFS